MKFSKYFMLAGAAALFAACSSEEPVNGPTNTGDEDGMYLAINVVGAATRADDATVEGTDDENKINKIQVFVLNEKEELYFTKIIRSSDIDGGKAKFSVTTATYQDMLAKAERGAEMKIIVYANGTDLKTSEQIMHGSTTDATWGVLTFPGGEMNQRGFIMSNAQEVKEGLDKPAAGMDGSKDNPWVIKTDIVLSRLATRFEYSDANKSSYTALHESGVQLAIAGFDVETFVNSTYRVSQFTEDGLVPNEFISGANANHTHFEPAGKFQYRMTEKVINDELDAYMDFVYPLTTSNKVIYKRPNTISATYEMKNTAEDYQAIPFAVVKASFTCSNFAGSGSASASMAAGDEVYAIDGIFVGGFKDFMALRNAGKQFKVNYDTTADFDDADKNKIKAVEDNYNRLLAMHLPTENGNTSLSNDEWFKKGLGDNTDIYTKDAADGKYYTYYAALIINDKDKKDDPAWYYGVSRNTSYALLVNSFKFLGNSGGGQPGEGPTPADLSDMGLQLTVKVQKWTLNTANKWDL